MEEDPEDRGQPLYIDESMPDMNLYKDNIRFKAECWRPNQQRPDAVSEARLKEIQQNALRNKLLKTAMFEVIFYVGVMLIIMSAAFQNIHGKAFPFKNAQAKLFNIPSLEKVRNIL